MTKTITLDQGAFLGKKDFTLEDYLKQWDGWAVQFGNLCGTTEEFEKYKNLCKDTKDLAAKNFEEMYQKQQIENDFFKEDK